nr:MAG TPA: tail tape measure protein [Caudoviricetes sp.]
MGGSATKLFGKIKGALTAAAIAKAIGDIAKASISAYADYEQMVGGVETLFGTNGKSLEEYAADAGKTVDQISDKYNSLVNAQSIVFDNAKKAYKTAGVSATQYMDTATSFAASLISGLKGDTETAAKLVDLAILDMSDNANKMGTDMASIQNAYQGFAKQNYTMLDNLKLGYGGTQSEMKRLLRDAQKLSGQKYNIKNLNDIIEAIHVIQDEMEITGTTQKEASETISGSWNATKAAWDNLLTGLSDGNADIDSLVKGLGESAWNVTKNVAKAAGNLVMNTGKVFQSIFTIAGNAISDGWQNTVWPWIQKNFKATLGIDLPDWPTVVQSVKDGWETLKTGLVDAFKFAIQVAVTDWETIKQTLTDLWNSIVEWWESIKSALTFSIVPQFGTSFGDAVKNTTPANIKKATGGKTLWQMIQSIWGGGNGGQHEASGMRRVPYDGFKARLHENEAVLTASQAAIWRGERMPSLAGIGALTTPAQTEQPVNLTINISGNTNNPYEVAQAVRNAVDDWRWRG